MLHYFEISSEYKHRFEHNCNKFIEKKVEEKKL